jgi:hypothetical protein
VRLRTIKPGFFENEDLAALPPHARLLFAGLWCLADREGRLEDRPARIKAKLFPYEHVDVDPLLDLLANAHFITRYQVADTKAIQVTNWSKHQHPHVKEGASTIPAPDQHHTCPSVFGILSLGSCELGSGVLGSCSSEPDAISPLRQLAKSARMQAESARISGDIKAEQRFLNQAANFERRAGEVG